MAKLQEKCPVCGKKAIEKSHTLLEAFQVHIINLECGHSITRKIEKKKDWEEIETFFGAKAKLYPYQGEGYEFARESGFRCLIGDEPGLGKTFQADACLRLHPETLLPALIICKSSLKLQQMREVLRICGPDFQPQIIESSKDKPNPIFPVIIATYDILWRISKKQIDAAEKAEHEVRERLNLMPWDVIPENERVKIPEVTNIFSDFKFKCAILDECQQIKNQQSKRAQQVRDICRDIPHVIATSGSAIENNAGEYFTILNILAPAMFPDYKRYIENDCDWYWTGRGYKVGGLRDPQAFFAKTKNFIIRRKKADVLPDLPLKERKFISCDFASKKMEADYNALQEEFVDFYNEHEGEKDFAQGILAKMVKLRHKAGINKVPFATEFITNWILDTEPTRKILIGVEHQDVGQMLAINLSKAFAEMRETGAQINDPLTYTSDLNSIRRNELVERFKNIDADRVMIASTKAAGEGLDGLQRAAYDLILLERQWNPKKEEQFEDRLARIGSVAVDGSITCNYILSAGTIDEYMTELVEVKRSNVDQTLDGKEYNWNEGSLIRELADIIARKGGKKWRLS